MLHSALRLGPLSSDLNASIFRKTALGVTAATIIGASLLTPQAVRAESPANKFAAACALIKNPEKNAGCLVDAISQHTKAMRAEELRLKAEEERSKSVQQQAEAVQPCIDFLLGKVAAKLTTTEELKKRAGGDLTDANVCGVAKTFGFERRAEVKPAGAKLTPAAYTR